MRIWQVIYACFKRRLIKEIKVAQLAGFVAEHTAYHHGEASLHGTIVKMAQRFVGTNNLPLLEAAGQFGTRLQGGEDAASPRYIFTQLRCTSPLRTPAQSLHQPFASARTLARLRKARARARAMRDRPAPAKERG